MAFLSVHTMEGDPDDLLARKRQHMDPVVQRLAPSFGAIWSVTARTDKGIITVNLWSTPEGAARFKPRTGGSGGAARIWSAPADKLRAFY